MLQKMRDGAQTSGAKILVGIIVLVLVLFGFGGFNLFTGSEPTAATVNGEEITETALLIEIERRRAQLLEQLGDDANSSLIDSGLLRQSTLELLINRALLNQFASELDFVTSSSHVDYEILLNPQFQLDGDFNEDLFRVVLANNGFSPASFRHELNRDGLIAQLSSGFNDTSFFTEREIRDFSKLLTQKRDVAYLEFKPDKFSETLEVPLDDINFYYEENANNYRTEESVDLEYVELSLRDLMAGEIITEGEVAEAYSKYRLAQKTTGRRRAAHILLEVTNSRDREQAVTVLNGVRSEITNGASFAEKASVLSEDASSARIGGDLGFVALGTFVPAFESAVWELDIGEISEPVVTEFGVHLITLLEVEEIVQVSFNDARDGLIDTLKRERATGVFETQYREMDEIAFEDTLETIVTSLNLELRSLSGVTRENGEWPFDSELLRDAIFEEDVIEHGYNTKAVKVGDVVIVARVRSRNRAQKIPVEDVMDEIRRLLTLERAGDKANIAAREALSRVIAGDPVAEIADAYGLSWTVHEGMRASEADVPLGIVQAAFKLSPPGSDERSAMTTKLFNGSHATVTVTQIELGEYGALTEVERTSIGNQMRQLAGERDLAGLINTLRGDAGL